MKSLVGSQTEGMDMVDKEFLFEQSESVKSQKFLNSFLNYLC